MTKIEGNGRAEIRKLARANRRRAGRDAIKENARLGRIHKTKALWKKKKAKRKLARKMRKIS